MQRNESLLVMIACDADKDDNVLRDYMTIEDAQRMYEIITFGEKIA